MEEHYTDDYAILAEGPARVFGYAPIEVNHDHSLYGLQWRQALDAENNRPGKMQSYLQYCSVSGVMCAWCGENAAVGYIRYECGCGGSRWCSEWVCAECA